MTDFYLMVDSTVEEKQEFCAEIAAVILEKVRAAGKSDLLLQMLINSAVHSISIDIWTRDCASYQARDQIYRDSMSELANILGLSVNLETYRADEVN